MLHTTEFLLRHYYTSPSLPTCRFNFLKALPLAVRVALVEGQDEDDRADIIRGIADAERGLLLQGFPDEVLLP